MCECPCEFEHYLFKITAEIEIRLLRPTSRRSCVGFVSHMFFHCHEMRLLVSSLVSISLTFIPLLRVVFMARSFAPVVCRRKFHGKGIKFETFRHVMWSSSMAWWPCEVRSNRRYRVQFLLKTFFFPSSFFFLFCFVLISMKSIVFLEQG